MGTVYDKHSKVFEEPEKITVDQTREVYPR